MLRQNCYSHRLCECGFVPEWREEEEMDRKGGCRGAALSGEGQQVKPVGILGDGAPWMRW